MAKDIVKLLKSQRINFKDPKLYIQALTHRSYLNERKENEENYQRLEFMGDAVLQLLITDYIYKNFQEMDEGSMSLLRSNLVRMETLAQLAKNIDLGEYILLGSGETKAKGQERPSLLSDVYEAFIAAIYLDAGIKSAERFVSNQYQRIIEEQGMETFMELKDPKTRLQELVQADDKRALEYITLTTKGPANAPIFEVMVKLENMVLGIGQGPSKKLAEQAAAKDALSKMAQGKGDINEH
jgi:ribonuclease III